MQPQQGYLRKPDTTRCRPDRRRCADVVRVGVRGRPGGQGNRRAEVQGADRDVRDQEGRRPERGRHQRDQGDRQGHRPRTASSRSSSPSNADQINDQFTETNLGKYRAVIFLDTRRRAPAQRRAEGRVRELLPQRRRLPRDRLRDRDRARLAVLHRHPRDARVRQDGRAVGDDQGRRPRPRRDEEPARVLEPDRRLVQLHGERPRRLARPRHGRRGSVRPAAAGPGARRDRRRHDGRRPSGRLVQGLQGRPLLLHRRSATPPSSFDEAAFRSHLAGAIDWAAGVADPVYSDCGATVLANYQQIKISARRT